MSSAGGNQVYTARELASAAGVSAHQVEALMATGELPSVAGRYVSHAEAVLWGRRLRAQDFATAALVAPLSSSAGPPASPPSLFEAQGASRRQPALPAAISAAAHLLVGVMAILITTAGLNSATEPRTERVEPMRLVYLIQPGPGGGGGGGGLKQPKPPPPAKRQGQRSLSSPIPEPEPPPPVEPPKVEPPPPPPPEEKLPPVVAPVVAAGADESDRQGELKKSEDEVESHGPGDNGGAGSGAGTGIGEGQGPGIGPGSGGGTGGGPYRPGSGVEPPRLLREVKPIYTDDARRRNITGDVVLEIVVRSDGSVGNIRVLDGLGYGLDQRAADAVRQWRFSPARRLGQPVDVLVEVAVEFRLR